MEPSREISIVRRISIPNMSRFFVWTTWSARGVAYSGSRAGECPVPTVSRLKPWPMAPKNQFCKD